MQFVSFATQIASAFLAILAAILWAKSARIQTPDKITAFVEKPDGTDSISDPLGGKYMGHVFSQDLKQLVAALRKQSQLSAYAAYCAAGAALLQGMALFIPSK